MPLFDGGYGFVVESSGHKATVPVADADAALVARFEAEDRTVPAKFVTMTFMSHRPAADATCWCDDPESSWCMDGNGTAWRRVRVPETRGWEEP